MSGVTTASGVCTARALHRAITRHESARATTSGPFPQYEVALLGRCRTAPANSKTWKAGGKSSGKFLKTVGVSENRWVSARGRATGSRGEEGTGRVVDLSGCNDRLAGFVHSITTLPSLRSRACARDQSRWFGVGPGSLATRSVSDDKQSKKGLSPRGFNSRSGWIAGWPWWQALA